MNIFYLNASASVCATEYVDSHVTKMILETAQILSTVTQELSQQHFGHLYKVTHKNHPCVKWAGQSLQNVEWLVNLVENLNEEKMHRYDSGPHKSKWVALRAYDIITNPMYDLTFPETTFTTPPACMPDKYIIEGDIIQSYRNYYRDGKKHLHRWKNREKPEWISK